MVESFLYLPSDIHVFSRFPPLLQDDPKACDHNRSHNHTCSSNHTTRGVNRGAEDWIGWSPTEGLTKDSPAYSVVFVRQ
jgi:hypothetical protein